MYWRIICTGVVPPCGKRLGFMSSNHRLPGEEGFRRGDLNNLLRCISPPWQRTKTKSQICTLFAGHLLVGYTGLKRGSRQGTRYLLESLSGKHLRPSNLISWFYCQRNENLEWLSDLSRHNCRLVSELGLEPGSFIFYTRSIYITGKKSICFYCFLLMNNTAYPFIHCYAFAQTLGFQGTLADLILRYIPVTMARKFNYLT